MTNTDVVKKVQMAGYSQSLVALVTDKNGEKWVYDLQFNTRTWKDEADYLDNATTDFEGEWEVESHRRKRR
jgi:hypothetical protein